MSEMVRLDNVVKEYVSGDRRQRAVDGVSLIIERGEFVILLGPSGSGKTTLLNIIASLTRPSSGEVRIDGMEINALTDSQATRFRAENLGLVFQFYNLLPTLTAVENVELGVALVEKDPRSRRERALRYLRMVGLEGMENKFPDQLSGGEQQRVSVARGLAMEPKLLIADEPTGNLDSETGEGIWTLLRDLNRRTGTTIVAVTHWDEAARYAHRAVRLRSGRLDGSAQQAR